MMPSRRRCRAALLALALTFAGAVAARAQDDAPPAGEQTPGPAADAPPPGAQPQAQSQAQPQAQMPPTPQAHEMAARIEKQITALQRRLRISPAQMAQWDGFVKIMRDNAARADAARVARVQQGPVNAVLQLRAYAAALQARADDMQRLLPAFEALYEALSPDQQKIADTTFTEFQRRLGR